MRLELFQLFGLRVKVDTSWVFLALLVAWSLAQGLFPALYEGLPSTTYWWMGLAGVVGLFFSLLFHEMSHSIIARRYGLPIRGITLFLFGGMAEMEEEPASPKTEFLMAIAGPIASGLLAAIFHAVSAIGQARGLPEAVLGVAQYLALLNGLLAIFNLLPAFPLDGGRVFRAALWYRTGDLRSATRAASRVGAGFGYALMGLGMLNILTGNLIGGFWWFLIGLFLRGAAAASYYQLMTRRALEGEPVRRFMARQPITVPPGITVRQFVDDYVYTYYHDLFPVTENDRLLGCVTTHQVKEVPREQWDLRTVRGIAAPCSEENTIAADQDAVDALSLMQRTNNSRLMVTEDGRLVGIIALKDLLKLFALKMDLEKGE
jgi:Zn-dependent protease/predicted transcriptional regulator